MTDQLSNKVEINTFIVSAFYPEVSHYTYEAGCLEFQKSSWDNFILRKEFREEWYFSNFSCMFLNPNNFFQL